MERLTSRNEKGDLLVLGEYVYAGNLYEAADTLEQYEDTGLTPKEVAEFAAALRNFQLIKLPLPIGSTIYQDGDKAYPIEIESVGVYLKAAEEGGWWTFEEFIHDFAAEIAAALKGEERK